MMVMLDLPGTHLRLLRLLLKGHPPEPKSGLTAVGPMAGSMPGVIWT